MTAQILFYPGDGVFGALVRRETHSAFGHVSVRITDDLGDRVYESVLTHAICRPFDALGADATATIVPVDFETPMALSGLAFLDATINAPYDLGAVAEDAAIDILGMAAWVALRDTSETRWDCSRRTATFLRLSGYPMPDDNDLRCPVSPGDLYRLLTKQRANQPTGTGI